MCRKQKENGNPILSDWFEQNKTIKTDRRKLMKKVCVF